MSVRQSYNRWASQYDTNLNKTRDLEATVLRNTLSGASFNRCLEIGCGTGKNTQWLANHAAHITAIDVSEEMISRARSKVKPSQVNFIQADIKEAWMFTTGLYDLITFSLVLEHIEDLDPVFKKSAAVLQPGGCVYIGELHPFKQYAGSKARFSTEEGEEIVQCFNHHLSDFIQSAKKYDLVVSDVNEYFDDDNRQGIPRILAILLKKKA